MHKVEAALALVGVHDIDHLIPSERSHGAREVHKAYRN